MEWSQNRRRNDEELMALYRTTVSDLAELKSAQRQGTNYCIAVYGGLIAAGKWVVSPGFSIPGFSAVLATLAVATAVAGSWYLSNLQDAIKWRHYRHYKVSRHFGADYWLAWAGREHEDGCDQEEIVRRAKEAARKYEGRGKTNILPLLYGVVWIGAVLTLYVLFGAVPWSSYVAPLLCLFLGIGWVWLVVA